ncbi:acyloxyacyl hydrolase [Amphiplicatus metriothermophilus]|uniref:acyloxyacyl hydrolase n=1 Tax=Amphiplicatus metriothermophilus TaxID=1519374 RepID=UPI001359305D|nr:acyloxyacyl hydrolase [Amphiplicatus metriothermophilus]MBB5517888.1 lipid A 3-O-deacylase [Amphiplicatus metriothermophilus]
MARQAAITGALMAATILLIGRAAASSIDEIRVGAALQDTGPFADNKEKGAALSAEVLFDSPEALAFLGRPRPQAGVSVATAGGATSYAYAGLAWDQSIGRRFFVSAAAGFAVHDGETGLDSGEPIRPESAYLGCRLVARLAGDVGYRLSERLSLSVHLSHLSNAGLCSPNEGLDALGFRLGYRF